MRAAHCCAWDYADGATGRTGSNADGNADSGGDTRCGSWIERTAGHHLRDTADAGASRYHYADAYRDTRAGWNLDAEPKPDAHPYRNGARRRPRDANAIAERVGVTAQHARHCATAAVRSSMPCSLSCVGQPVAQWRAHAPRYPTWMTATLR